VRVGLGNDVEHAAFDLRRRRGSCT
jgi:hypothetical protein